MRIRPSKRHYVANRCLPQVEQILGLNIPNVTAIALQAHDTLDFALARYKIIDLPEIQQYQPIVYIDTDVVCNSALDGLYWELCFSDVVHALSEGPLFHDADFFGKTLFDRDSGVANADALGISTGILGFRNVDCVKSQFQAVLGSAYAFAREQARRDYFPAFDQPFANYIFRKGFSAIGELEHRAAVNLYIHEPSHRPEDRLGLIHFAGGVGNATPKVERMRGYYETITRTEPAVAPENEV
jgi:hypothetical protein